MCVTPKHLVLCSASSLLEGSNVCALCQEPFPVAVEQSSLGTHGSLHVEAPFLATVEPKAENLSPLGANS
jgi:hypothetical protein